MHGRSASVLMIPSSATATSAAPRCGGGITSHAGGDLITWDILVRLRGVLVGVGNRASGEGLDPPQCLPHQHVGALAFGRAPFPLRRQIPVTGGELGAEIVHFGAQLLDQGAVGIRSRAGRIRSCSGCRLDRSPVGGKVDPP